MQLRFVLLPCTPFPLPSSQAPTTPACSSAVVYPNAPSYIVPVPKTPGVSIGSDRSEYFLIKSPLFKGLNLIIENVLLSLFKSGSSYNETVDRYF